MPWEDWGGGVVLGPAWSQLDPEDQRAGWERGWGLAGGRKVTPATD